MFSASEVSSRPIGNFLGLLDPKIVERLSSVYHSEINERMRALFNEAIEYIRNNAKNERPSCFICHNTGEDHSLKTWLHMFVQDLKLLDMDVKYSSESMNICDNLEEFEAKAGETDFAIIIWTEKLGAKYKASCRCVNKDEVPGVTREIRLIQPREPKTIIPLFLDCKFADQSNPFHPSPLLMLEVCRNNYSEVLKVTTVLRGLPNRTLAASWIERLKCAGGECLIDQLHKQNERIRGLFDECIQIIGCNNFPKPKIYILHDRPSAEWVTTRIARDLVRLGISPISNPIEFKPAGDLLGKTGYDLSHIDFALVIRSQCKDNNGHLMDAFVGHVKNQAIRANCTVYSLLLVEGSETPAGMNTGDTLDTTSEEAYFRYALGFFLKTMPCQTNIVYEFEAKRRALLEGKTAESYRSKESFLFDSRQQQKGPTLVGVPKENLCFVSREGIDLKNAFKEQNIIALVQPKGILCRTGKTALALDYARSVFHYGKVIWIDASKEISWDVQFERPGQLIVLDDMTDQEVLKPFLNACKFSDILITSRCSQWKEENVKVIKIEPLSKTEAKDMFEKLSKCPDVGAFADTWIEKFEGVPFLIQEAARDCCETRSFETYLEVESYLLQDKKRLLPAKGNISTTDKNIEVCSGRAHEIEYCNQWFSKNQQPLFIDGNNRVGQTHFAQHYALLKAYEYDYIGYVSCESDSLRISCYRSFAKILQLEVERADEAVHEFINGKKTLLILDNVTRIDQIPKIKAHLIVIACYEDSNLLLMKEI